MKKEARALASASTRRRFFALALTIAYCLLPTPCLWARGLSVNLSVIKLSGVEPGAFIDAGKSIAKRITLRNTGSGSRTYSITFHKPSEIGVKWNRQRYEEIPSADWLSTFLKEVTIDANSEKEITVYLEVPDEDMYYGRRFCAVMAVAEVPQYDAAIPIVLAVYPLIEIETIKEK